MENAYPTRVSPSNAPMICPPILSETTNIRRGTRSASSNFQTSFCKFTHALNSSWPWHLRTTICPAAGDEVLTCLSPPCSWPAATMLPYLRAMSSQGSFPAAATAPQASQNAAGICGWFCAAPIPDRRRDSGQYLPEQKTGHLLHLQYARAALPRFAACFLL